MNSFRADVTSIVKPIIDAGPAGLYNFTVSEVTNGLINGEALVIICQKASLHGDSCLLISSCSFGC